MFKRIKNLWELGRYKASDKAEIEVNGEPVLTLEENIPLGDGKAVFFGEGTEEEFKEFEKEEQGMKPWYDRINNL